MPNLKKGLNKAMNKGKFNSKKWGLTLHILPVAQWRERRFPEPETQVRFLSGGDKTKMFKEKLKKLFPKVYLFYRQLIGGCAAFFYGWPSSRLIVIGVTGTAGKSTVVNLIAKILESAGFKVGMVSSFNFKIKQKEWPNTIRMTMPGPFYLQKLLSQMVKENCQFAVIETTSQGLIHQRHLGVNYDLAVFTNLLPEHLEAHQGFENYKKAKGILFASLKKKKKISVEGAAPAGGQGFASGGEEKEIKKIKVINLDDQEADYFLNFKSDLTYGYGLKSEKHYSKFCSSFSAIASLRSASLRQGVSGGQNLSTKCQKIISPAPGFKIKENGLEFTIEGVEFKTSLLSKFNLYNLLAAIAACLPYTDLERMKIALEKVEIPGRFEIVKEEPFKVVIDYAHTPDELLGVYEFFKDHYPGKRLIAVFGSCGGSRDVWKRKVLGEIADRFCQEIILTNEDPYDDNPLEIIEEIAQGISVCQNLYKILDRRKAIKKALSLAKKGDIVLITGKGAEKSIISKKGKKIPWSDKEVVKEDLKGI